MALSNIKTGIEHLPQGSTNFYRISNTWSLALKAGAMTVGAIALANLLVVHSEHFDTSVRNMAKCSNMSRGAVQSAMGNLVDLGLADPVMRGNSCLGYRVYFSRTPKIPGIKFEPHEIEGGPNIDPVVAQNMGQLGSEFEPHIKTPLQDSSLRSVERHASTVPAEARPVATISTGIDGQSGFSFADDQGVIPEMDIQRIMAELRRAGIKGDPDDYELRDFITSRIAFMTASTFKGKPMVRGDKDVAQANRNRVVTFCMRIIGKEDFRWSSKRVDPSLRRKADEIRAQIAELTKSAASYRMQDGSVISGVEYDAIALDLQTHRDEMISKRIRRRPDSYTVEAWRRYLNDSFTIKVVAEYIYQQKAPAHLPADEDRSEQRRKISELQAQLAAMA